MANLKRGVLRITYLVSGKNINYIPEYLHIRGVSVYNYERLGEEKCSVTIDRADNDKFFAICKNMCYNKRVTRYKGILSPFVRFIQNFSLSLGTLAFVTLSYLLGGVILSVEVEGSAKRFERETLAVVESLGVKKYSLFSSVDYKEIENAVMSENPRVTFVTAYKRGNALVVSAEVSSSVTEPLSKNTSDIKTEVSGIVEEVSVLRGTALVKEGDKVSVGDTLVGAYILGKEEDEKYKTFTVARVKVLETLTVEYSDRVINDREIELCYALSEFNVKSGEVVSKSHKIEGDKIVVTLVVRHVYFGGNT